MTDIQARLREYRAHSLEYCKDHPDAVKLFEEAADEIARLTEEVERLTHANEMASDVADARLQAMTNLYARIKNADALAETVEARLQSQSLLEDDQTIFAMRMALTAYQGKGK